MSPLSSAGSLSVFFYIIDLQTQDSHDWPSNPFSKENDQQTLVCWTLLNTHLSERGVNYSMPYFFSVTNLGIFQLGPFITLPF